MLVCLQELVSRPDSDVVVNVIDKDLDRTFPSHVLFKKESGYVVELRGGSLCRDNWRGGESMHIEE